MGDMAASLQHDLIETIRGQPDMEVVGKAGCRGVALLVEVGRAHPDAVVLGSDDGELRGECSQLLSEFPDIRVVAVISGDPPDVCYEIRRVVFTGTGGVTALLDVIRSAVPHRTRS